MSLFCFVSLVWFTAPFRQKRHLKECLLILFLLGFRFSSSFFSFLVYFLLFIVFLFFSAFYLVSFFKNSVVISFVEFSLFSIFSISHERGLLTLRLSYDLFIYLFFISSHIYFFIIIFFLHSLSVFLVTFNSCFLYFFSFYISYILCIATVVSISLRQF